MQSWQRWLVAVTMATVMLTPAVGAAGAMDRETAARLVGHFLLLQGRPDLRVAQVVALTGSRFGNSPVTMGYRADLAGGGYVLLGVNEAFLPVKAFSFSRDFSQLPPAWQRYLAAEMEARARGGIATGDGRQPAAVARAWEALRHPDRFRRPAAAPTWLLDSAWDQGPPFNSELERRTGANVLVGCVNVAMGQVMRYWQYPARGRGVVSHHWQGLDLDASLEHDYRWDRMPGVLDGTDPVGEARVARLLADLGIANRTNFGRDNSGTGLNPQVLVERFGYATTIRTVATATTDGQDNLAGFLAAIRDEIAADRPMLFSIPGHMGVIDGYDDTDPTGAHVHVNFGWGGMDDGFYYVDRDVVAGGYIFSSQYPFIVYTGIKPCSASAGDCGWYGLEGGDQVGAGGTIAGRFHHPYDADWYPLCLAGDVSFTGDRGYANQAFYLTLYDEQMHQVAGGDGEPVTANGLAAGRYWLRASLWSESGSRFRDWDGDSFRDYTVTASGSVADGASCVPADRPPEILAPATDLVLAAGESRTLLVDGRDPDGDAVSLAVSSSNPAGVSALLDGDVLTVTGNQAGTSGLVRLTATAGGMAASRELAVYVTDHPGAVGREWRVTGTFAGQDEMDRYWVVLDGACRIGGDNGYSNQAFYVGVQRPDGTWEVAPTDSDTTTTDVIVHTFSRGRYLVTASLQQGNSFYSYEPGRHSAYQVSGSCDGPVLDRPTVAALLSVDPAGLAGVGLADLVGMLRVLALAPPAEIPLAGWDRNGDGRLDPGDAAGLAAALAGL